MKLRIAATALALLVAGGPAWAQVNALPPDRHILVYGEAQAEAVPDRFRITVSLDVTDPQVDVARRKVEGYMRTILGLLEDADVSGEDVTATSLRIAPETHYDNISGTRLYDGMGVSRKITARFASLPSLQGFLADLATSEEVQVSGVDAELSSEAAIMKALREKAIADTRAKAEVIAASYGVRLAGLYSVSDVPPDFDYGIQEGDWPVTYRWEEETSSLDRIQVTGSRIEPGDLASFQAGTVTLDDRIYAVFLIAD